MQYVLYRYRKFVPYYKLASDLASITYSVLRAVGRYPLLYCIELGERGRKERKRKSNIFHSYIAHAIYIHRICSALARYFVVYVIGAWFSLFLRLCIVSFSTSLLYLRHPLQYSTALRCTTAQYSVPPPP